MAPEGTYDYGWWSATILNILLFGGAAGADVRPHNWQQSEEPLIKEP